MGNELNDESEIKENKPKEDKYEYFKYGVISKKGEERANEDTFLYLSDLITLSNNKNKIHFGLFGVFDGHNNDYVSKYLRDNCKNVFEEKIGELNKDNYQQKIENIFKTLDENLKKESEEKDLNDINNLKNVNMDENEIKFYKDIINNTKESPEDIKNIENSDMKDLLLFIRLYGFKCVYSFNK